MRNDGIRRVFTGVLFLALGVAIIGQLMNWWNLGTLPRSWWTLFLIVPGIAGILSTGFEFWNISLVVLGIWLLAIDQGWLTENAWLWLAGVALILLGVKILFHIPNRVCFGARSGNFDGTGFSRDEKEFPEYSCVFSTIHVAGTSKSLKGGKATAVFGQMAMDLREAGITGNAVFEVSCVFGNMEIMVPKDVPVKFDIAPVFGTFHNAASFTSPKNGEPFLLIKGASVFGNISAF